MKKISTVIVALALAVVMTVAMPLRVFAAGTPTYVSDLMVATASSLSAAKKLLTKAGYTPISTDVNQGNSGVVCIGYKTTTNRDEAITDIAIMNMNGGYSFEDYNHVLEEYQESADKMVNEIYAAVSEYRANYKEGKYGAILAHNLLNRFYDEDYGTENNLLGDLLASDELTKENLSVIFMQASVLAVTTIECCLGIACSDNWIERFVNMPANTTYTTEDDDNARTIYKSFSGFQEEMNSYVEIINATDLTMDSSEEEWSAYYDSLTEKQQEIVTSYANTYDYLKATEYKNGTLYDFFMQDLNEIDNSDLYPLAKAMTAGQIATVNYASLCSAIQYATFSDDVMKVMIASVEKSEETETVSVFDGVDRSIFSADGIALTSEAMRQATSNSDYSWVKGNLSEKAETIFYSVMGVTAGIASIGLAVWAFASYKTSIIAAGAYQFQFAGVEFAKYLPEWMVDYEVETFAEAWESAEFDDFVYVFSQRNDLEGVREAAIQASAKTSWGYVAGAAKIISAIAIAAVLITIVIYLVMEYKSYKKKKEYSDIPRIIVDQATAADGTRKYTYYYAVKDTKGEYADLNNWTGNEWLALYYTKDTDAGNPILPSATVQLYRNTADDSSYDRPVHAFGSTAATSLNRYALKSGIYTYLFFKSDKTSSLAGTSVTYGNYALVGASGIVLGAAGMYFINKAMLKKKKVASSES